MQFFHYYLQLMKIIPMNISVNIFVKYFDDADNVDDDSYLNHLFFPIPLKSSYIYHANE